MPSQEKIAFTSCVRLEAFRDQPEWTNIQAENPDFLFLLGDQIYMDYGLKMFSDEWNGKPESYSVNTFRSIMAGKYQAQWEEPHFKELFDSLRQDNRVFGVWDDHDFAWNNAVGSKVPADKRQISFELFAQRFPISIPGEIYQSIDTNLARVILLDVRSHAHEPYEALPLNESSALLGDTQFEFLKEKLFENHGKPYTIICSGITLRFGEECWSKYEKDFIRLMWAIEQSGKTVLFLAGDIHENKFVKPTESCPCYEIISSGLAVNYLGLGIPSDDRHNWGMLELSEQSPSSVTLVKSGRRTTYIID